MPAGPLTHVRIVDLTTELGSVAVRLLTGLGARVTRIEPPAGDPLRSKPPFAQGAGGTPVSLWWLHMMSGRETVAADLAVDEGRQALLSLLDDADLVIESRPAGELAALGLDYGDLADRFPRLIWTSISPFGRTGPAAAWQGTDLIGMAAGGLLSLCGDPDRAPLRPSVEQGSAHAGLQAMAGSLVALHARNATGRGQLVDVSMQEAIACCLGNARLFYEFEGIVTKRAGGGRAYGAHGSRLVYPCRDGFVAFGRTPDALGPLHDWMVESGLTPGFNPDEWARLPQSGPGTPGPEKARELEAPVEAFFASRDKMNLYEEGQGRGIMICPVSSPADLLVNDQLIARRYFEEAFETVLGRPILVPGPPVRMSATPWCGGGDEEPRGTKPQMTQKAQMAPPGGHGRAEPETAAAATTPSVPSVPSVSSVVSSSVVSSPAVPRLPLAGLRVADFSWVGVGPLATQTLAWMGAEVIRVESSTRLDTFRNGGPQRGKHPDSSAYWANCNRDKLGITLNLKHGRAREIALRLAQVSDVVAESFTPGFMASVGLTYEDFRAVNPNIIMISASMEGADGPHAQFRGFGLVLQATVGFTHFTSWPDRSPVGTGVAYTDWVATHFASTALLSALEHRRRTGEGQYIDLSQLESCIWALDAEVLRYTARGELRPPLGNRHESMAPHGVFPAAGDDQWIAIAVRDDRDWAALVDVVDDANLRAPALAALDGRCGAEDAIESAIARWSAARDKHEAAGALQAAGVPAYAVAHMADVEHDPQLRARGHYWPTRHPVIGDVDWNGPAYHLSETPLGPRNPAPLLGEHNERVFREVLGYSDEEFADLVASGALD